MRATHVLVCLEQSPTCKWGQIRALLTLQQDTPPLQQSRTVTTTITLSIVMHVKLLQIDSRLTPMPARYLDEECCHSH